MKYLIFSVLFLLLCYLIVFFVCYFINKNKNIKFDNKILSKDASNSLKGLFIILIMLAHIGNSFGVRYLNPLGSWGVAVFLMCSGFGLQMSYKKSGLKDFWKKRILTAYVPYLVIELIGYIFLYSDIGIKQIILDLMLINPIHPYGWYMQCLFWYYIAFYLASLISKKDNIRICIVFALSIILFIFSRSLFRQQLFSFVVGMFMATYYEIISKYISKIYCCVIFTVLGVLTLAIKQLPVLRNASRVVFYLTEALQTVFLLMAGICIVTTIIQISGKKLMLPFAFVGLISNEIYLIHAFLIPSNISYLSIGLFFVSTLVVTSFVFLLKNIFRKWLFLNG